MDFEEYDSKRYRSLDLDGLEQRKAQLIELATNPDTPDEVISKLDGETERCAAEFKRREKVKNLRDTGAAAILGGQGTVVASTQRGLEKPKDVQTRSDDPFATHEYELAFMRSVQKGEPLPTQFREYAAQQYRSTAIDGTYLSSTDTPVQIPTTMQREVIKKMEERGGIYAKVRKVSIQGGIWFRVRDMKVTASWISEKETSDPQTVKDDTQLMFSYNQLECRIQRTLLSTAVTYEDFQADFVQAVSDAMVDAIEEAIIRGTGTGQPLGIVNDKRITNVVEMSAADVADWTKWHTKVKAAMPRLYRNGSFIMGQGTWDSDIETLRDKNDHPVSNTGYNPVTGEEEYRLMGKAVDTVDDSVLPAFEDAKEGDVFAIFGNLQDYLINTQPGMPLSVKTWDDDDKNLRKTRALMALDGKVLDAYGFILIKKAATPQA